MEQKKFYETYSDRRGSGADQTDDDDQKNQDDSIVKDQKDAFPNASSYLYPYGSAVLSSTPSTWPIDYYQLLSPNTSTVTNNDLIILHQNVTNDRKPGYGSYVHNDQALSQNHPNFYVLARHPQAIPLIGGWVNFNNPLSFLPESNNPMASFLITPKICSMDNYCSSEEQVQKKTKKELIERIGSSLLLSPNHGWVPSMNNYAASIYPQQDFLLNRATLPRIISETLLQSLYSHDLMYNMGTCSTTPVPQQGLNEAKESIATEPKNDACEPNSLTHHLPHGSTRNLASCSFSERPTKLASNKRKRKEKDAPRRPLSAYNLFFKDRRGEILKSGLQAIKDRADDIEKPRAQVKISSRLNSSTPRVRKGRNPPHHIISFKEMAQKISEQWKNISEEEKRQYQIKAKEEKERYQDELYMYHKMKQSKGS